MTVRLAAFLLVAGLLVGCYTYHVPGGLWSNDETAMHKIATAAAADVQRQYPGVDYLNTTVAIAVEKAIRDYVAKQEMVK
jgi:hypothetical protein